MKSTLLFRIYFLLHCLLPSFLEREREKDSTEKKLRQGKIKHINRENAERKRMNIAKQMQAGMR